MKIDLPLSNIEKFCEETGFRFEENGEIGFGRKCVGITDPLTDSFVAYAVYDQSYSVIARHTARTPNHAYHKGEYLAVLCEESDRIFAIMELENWIKTILSVGYRLEDYYEDHTATALFSGRKSIILKAVVDKINLPNP